MLLLDANVIDQCNRGNQGAADALRARVADSDVFVSQQAYNEMVVQPELPRTATANRLALQDLGIRIAPPGPFPERGAAYAGAAGGPQIISEADTLMAAQARAIGAEIWSFDRAFRNNHVDIENRLGVRIAPETYTIAPVAGAQDYRVGRRLLGLPPVEISVGGAVRAPGGGGPGPEGGGPGPGGGGRPGGGPPPPGGGGGAPPPPPGGAGPRAAEPGGGPAAAAPRAAASAAAEALHPAEIGGEGVHAPEARAPRGAAEEGGGAGGGVMIFQLALILIQMLPDPFEARAVDRMLNEQLNDPKWQPRWDELKPVVQSSKGYLYYNIKFQINYNGWQSPKPQAFPNQVLLDSLEVQSIDVSQTYRSSISDLDPKDKPPDAHLMLGGGYHWKAHRSGVTSVPVFTGEQIARGTPSRISIGELQKVAGFTSDSDIRDWVKAHALDTIAEVGTDLKLRMINRLLDGWVSDDDLDAVEKICRSVHNPDEMRAIRAAIEPRELDLTDLGQRTRLRIILGQMR